MRSAPGCNRRTPRDALEEVARGHSGDFRGRLRIVQPVEKNGTPGGIRSPDPQVRSLEWRGGVRRSRPVDSPEGFQAASAPRDQRAAPVGAPRSGRTRTVSVFAPPNPSRPANRTREACRRANDSTVSSPPRPPGGRRRAMSGRLSTSAPAPLPRLLARTSLLVRKSWEWRPRRGSMFPRRRFVGRAVPARRPRRAVTRGFPPGASSWEPCRT